MPTPNSHRFLANCPDRASPNTFSTTTTELPHSSMLIIMFHGETKISEDGTDALSRAIKLTNQQTARDYFSVKVVILMRWIVTTIAIDMRASLVIILFTAKNTE